GNKQRHYLLPLMPPVMMITAWLIPALKSWAWRLRVLVAITPIVMIVVVGVWIPKTRERDPMIEARALLRQFPDGNFYFAGGDDPNESLPLCFALRREIPILRGDSAALAAAKRDPRAV